MRTYTILLGTLLLAAAPLSAQTVPGPATGPVVAPPAPAPAPVATSPQAVATARQLMELMHVERTLGMMFDSMVPLMVNATVTALEANPATTEMARAMENSRPDGRERLLAIFREEFRKGLTKSIPVMIERTAREYAAAFTEAELREVIAFYSSGTGSKMLALQPEMQRKMALFGQETGREVGKEAGRRAIERAVNELLPKKESKS